MAVELSIPPDIQDFLGKVRAFRLSLPKRINDAERAGRFPPELLRECGKLGLCGMLVPKQYGGSGIGPLGYVLAIEELSRASASLGVVLSVHNSVGVFPIYQFGTEKQRMEFLPRLCSGEALAAFAVTEACAGSDVSSISTTAVREDDCWLLNGIKLFISNGEGEIVNVLASTSKQKGNSGQTMFIVRKGDKGFRIGSTEQKMGIHADQTCELVFEDCRIPADRLLGKENEGFKQAMQVLDTGRIGISAQAIGSTGGALDYAIEAVKRGGIAMASSTGPPPSSRINCIASNMAQSQTVQFAIAECATDIEAARLLILSAADMKQRGMSTTMAASMAKLQAASTANRVATRLVGIFGPDAVQGQNPIERFFRDSKVFEIYEGTSEIHQLIISRRLLGSL
jgi:alkylation response protein AidB-like acyl-CoA dehydrogenase